MNLSTAAQTYSLTGGFEGSVPKPAPPSEYIPLGRRSAFFAPAVAGDRRAAAGLFQRGVDRREHGVEGSAEAVDGRDDGEADARRNQPVLDRRSGRLVGQKSRKHRLHFPPSW